MSSVDLVRWGGLAAMLAGVAFIVLMLIPDPALGGSPFYIFGSVLLFIAAWLLLLVGLAGFHTLQKGHYGRIGRAGFYTAIAGASVMIVIQILTWVGLALGITALVVPDPVGLLIVMFGLVLYGVATLQARVLPRWCGVGFIVGVPVLIGISVVSEEYGEMLGGILFGLLWLALGYVLWSESGAAAEHPARVR
jgi:hypothetical protein